MLIHLEKWRICILGPNRLAKLSYIAAVKNMGFDLRKNIGAGNVDLGNQHRSNCRNPGVDWKPCCKEKGLRMNFDNCTVTADVMSIDRHFRHTNCRAKKKKKSLNTHIQWIGEMELYCNFDFLRLFLVWPITYRKCQVILKTTWSCFNFNPLRSLKRSSIISCCFSDVFTSHWIPG